MAKKNFAFALVAIMFIASTILITSVEFRIYGVTLNDFQTENKGLLYALSLIIVAISWWGNWIFNATRIKIDENQQIIIDLQKKDLKKSDEIEKIRKESFDIQNKYFEKVSDINDKITRLFEKEAEAEEIESSNEHQIINIQKDVKRNESDISKLQEKVSLLHTQYEYLNNKIK